MLDNARYRNKQMMLRESLGVVTEQDAGVFLKKTVKYVFERPRQDLPIDVSHAYVAIDPTGGGPSKFAIVSIIRHNGLLQVRFIDATHI